MNLYIESFACILVNRINIIPCVTFIIKSNKARNPHITLISVTTFVKCLGSDIIIRLCMQICYTKQHANNNSFHLIIVYLQAFQST